MTHWSVPEVNVMNRLNLKVTSEKGERQISFSVYSVEKVLSVSTKSNKQTVQKLEIVLSSLQKSKSGGPEEEI